MRGRAWGGWRRGRGARGARVHRRPQEPARLPPRGHSLAELTVALFLVGFIGAVVTTMVAGSTRVLVGVLDRSEAAETRRTVAALLHDELSVGVEGRDWHLDGERGVTLRAFRGYARICGRGAEPGSWRVAWQGIRAPDPERDSLLVVGHHGRWEAVEFTHQGSAPAHPEAATCQGVGGERVADWRGVGWGPAGGWLPGGDPHDPGPVGEGAPGAGPHPPQVPLLARYFEWGRYSLEDRAFRYRRGTGARQPLTPEVVDPASGLAAAPGGGMEVTLVLVRPDGTPSTDRWVVRGDRP